MCNSAKIVEEIVDAVAMEAFNDKQEEEVVNKMNNGCQQDEQYIDDKYVNKTGEIILFTMNGGLKRCSKLWLNRWPYGDGGRQGAGDDEQRRLVQNILCRLGLGENTT